MKILRQVGAKIYKTTPNFWRCYQDLSREIKELAKKKFALLIRDPKHPSLSLKKIGKQWAVRINRDYRALAREEDGNLV